jgi:hypothetical protein
MHFYIATKIFLTYFYKKRYPHFKIQIINVLKIKS